MFGHDRELDELGEKDRIGAICGQHDLVVSRLPRIDDRGKLAELRARELGVGDALDGIDHVVGGQRLAVMEGDAVADGELQFGVGQPIPFRRDLWRNLAAIVAGDDVVEDIAVDVIAVRIPLHVGVERRRFVDEVNHELVFGLGNAGAQRGCDGGNGYSRSDRQDLTPCFFKRRPSVRDR